VIGLPGDKVEVKENDSISMINPNGKLYKEAPLHINMAQ